MRALGWIYLSIAVSIDLAQAAQAENQGTVTPLKDYSLMGHAYQPVGSWTDPRTLKISFNVPGLPDQKIDPDSLRYAVKGDIISLYYKSISPQAGPDGRKQDCDVSASLAYMISDLPPGDYKVAIVGDRTYVPSPLHTIQEAQRDGLPSSIDVVVSKDGSMSLNGAKADFDDLDSLFMRAEPYQLMVSIKSNNTDAIHIASLAEEHRLPYSLPNYDQLLDRSVDIALSKYSAPPPKPTGPPEPWAPYGIKSKLPLTLNLTVPVMVLGGKAPQFTLDLKNDGAWPVRVVDVNSRGDLKDNYLYLRLTKDGKRVENIPVMISDVGPMGPNDSMVIGPGETIHIDYIP